MASSDQIRIPCVMMRGAPAAGTKAAKEAQEAVAEEAVSEAVDAGEAE